MAQEAAEETSQLHVCEAKDVIFPLSCSPKFYDFLTLFLLTSERL